jgi:cell division septum initiation protein DivIVA
MVDPQAHATSWKWPLSWSPISAEQLRTARLREAGLTRRGYRVEDVDALLSRAASEIEQWTNAYAAAQNEIEHLRNFYRTRGEDPNPRSAQAADHGAIELLARAQQHADALIADAQAHARHLQADARLYAEQLIATARREAADAGQPSANGHSADRLAALRRDVLSALQNASTQMTEEAARIRALHDYLATQLDS